MVSANQASNNQPQFDKIKAKMLKYVQVASLYFKNTAHTLYWC